MPITTELQWTDKQSVTLAEIAQLTKELISVCFTIDNKNILLQASGWKFDWQYKNKSFGSCTVRGGRKTIYMSKNLCSINLNNPKRIENTIRHEVAHALHYELKKVINHNDDWIRIAKLIKCSGERCFDSSTVVMPPSKYRGECPNCGSSFKYYRMPTRSKGCRHCCNKFNFGKYHVNYKLVIIEN